ncbi:MAG: hypothetical protein LBI78_00770 [Campylobacteraceae bacterium]|nr:hypothetical protein [Campylobacteraceae bacterium]
MDILGKAKEFDRCSLTKAKHLIGMSGDDEAKKGSKQIQTLKSSKRHSQKRSCRYDKTLKSKTELVRSIY